MEIEWITFPDGYSCNLKQIRTITRVYEGTDSYLITLRFNGSEKCYYDWEFPFDKYIESKEELYQKVEKLRQRLVLLSNNNKEPLHAMSLIDLKKKELVNDAETE